MPNTALSPATHRFGNCWISVNRECNLRCTWCYAKPVGYSKASRIDLGVYRRILPTLADLGIHHITILGGEPTTSVDLIEIIQLAAQYDIKATLVSNGIALADKQYVASLNDCGLEAIDISLKGSSETEYRLATHFSGFVAALQAITNIASTGMRLSVSTVLSNRNIETSAIGLQAARDAGAGIFSLSFCYDFSGISTSSKRPPVIKSVNSDVALIRAFEAVYPTLCAATEGQFSLMQSYPLCLWNPEIIRTMLERGQINSICQLLSQTGLVLDTDFSIIPCNAMSNIRLGKFDEDWTDADSLLACVDGEPSGSILDFLASPPDNECQKCELWSLCGGGCVSFWINNQFDDLVPYRQVWGREALGLKSFPAV